MNDREPCAKGTIFSAFRKAALEQFGQAGLDDLSARLSPDARANTIERPVIATEFLPERYVLEWYEAAFEGPAGRDLERFRKLIDGMMDHGFGRVQRFALQLIPPQTLVQRAPGFWRHDHTHGELVTELRGENSGRLTLRDHPYTTTPLARAAVAEVYRYAVNLSRVKHVDVSHELAREGELWVDVRWR